MSDGHAIAMALRATYLAMHRQADAQLAQSGVTADQFVLLTAMAEGEAMTQQELVRRTSSDPNTLRAMLVLLEKRDLVIREAHPTDRRARRVSLTSQGKRVYKELWTQIEPFRTQMETILQPEESRLLMGFLNRIANTIAIKPEQS